MSVIGRFLFEEGFATYEVDLGTGSRTRAPDRPEASLFVPGFVDIHIHGGFGIDFMEADRGSMEALCSKLRECGYEGFLPTTVTAPPYDVERALAALPDDPMVLGFHLEGPFISHVFPGAQPQASIALPPEPGSGWESVLDDLRLRVITLAPEIPGALALIERLSSRGVVVSMGHTNATYLEADAGHRAGARDTTHTYNAMRPLHHREAGAVGYALQQDDLACELIYDRHHVSREAAALLFRAKPADKVVAVSDGTLATGLPAGQTVRMWGLACVVGDRQVRLKDGTLAGSAITLLDAFRNLHEDFGPDAAIRACCLNPRQVLKLSGPPKVWVEFGPDLRILKIHRP